jgi:hypothetical protein
VTLHNVEHHGPDAWGPTVLRPARPASLRAETANTHTSAKIPLRGNMILISYKNGSAIYVASSPRRIEDGPSGVRGRFPLAMILDAALTSVPSSENSAWFWLISMS